MKQFDHNIGEAVDTMHDFYYSWKVWKRSVGKEHSTRQGSWHYILCTLQGVLWTVCTEIVSGFKLYHGVNKYQ